MAVTNLTGTKWLLNEELTMPEWAVYNLILKPNSYTFSVSDFVKIKSDYGFTSSTWEELINDFIVLMENMGGTVTSTLSVINDKGNYVILSPGWWQEEPVNEIRMMTWGLENELGNLFFGLNPTNILNLPEVSGTLSVYLYDEDEPYELNDLTFLDFLNNAFLGGAAWDEIPYSHNEWKFEQCRTIEITGGDDVTNPTLINWLETNATLVEYTRTKVDNKLNVVIGTKAQVEGDTSIPENSIVVVTDEEIKVDGLDPNEMAYFNYAGIIYGGKYNILANAWQDMKDSETVLFDIPLTLVAPNQEMGGMTVDLYAGSDGQLQALYDACANETILSNHVYFVNNVPARYYGDVSGIVGFPISLHQFGTFGVDYDNNSFLIGDLTPLSMGLGLVLGKIVNVSIPNNNIVIRQGVKFKNENGIIIPNSATSIGESAFMGWTSYNQPLVIPNSVTSIEDYAFENWISNNQLLVIPNSVTSIGKYAFAYWFENNQPLVIPDSVTEIGMNAFENWTSNNQPLVIPDSVTLIDESAFYNWTSNNHPLVIPDSVTSIGGWAFSNWTLVPYVEMKGITPPSIGNAGVFGNQNDAPIYVPDASVTAYKTATNWDDLADRIFPISDKNKMIVELTQAQYDALSVYDNNTYYLIVEDE